MRHLKSIFVLTIGLSFLLINKGFSNVNKLMVDSSKILVYEDFLSNLDGTQNAPEPDDEYIADFPYCNSINTYPSPFLPTEFSSLPFSTFCSNNVVSNITNRGTDVSYQVVVGGDFNVPATGGAEIEGRLAIQGDLVVNKAPAPFRVGESVSGTAVVSEPGSFLLVGGNSSGAGRINTGASAFGTYKSEIGGSSNLTINGASVVSGNPLSFDIDTLIVQTKAISNLMRDLPSTGSFSSGFNGSNSSLEVFNINNTDLLGTGSLPFKDIAPNSTIIINVAGNTVNYQKSVYNGRANDPLAISNSSDVDATVYNVVWNFYEASELNVISSPAEGIQGLVIVPDGDVDFRTNLNGRLITGGDVNVNGSGAEFHNYPFTGDLSDVIASAPSLECVIAVKDVGLTPLETEVTLDPILNDTIENGLTLEVTISESPLNGTVKVNPDNTISYTPNVGFTGLDSMKYVVCDVLSSIENCDSAYVVVLVGFKAVDDDLVAQTNELTTFFPLANDIINIKSTTIDTISGGKGGDLILNPDGSVSYTSVHGFSGRDSVTFLVCDTSRTTHVCDTSIAIIRLLSILPEAVDDNYATSINSTLITNVLDNDTYSSKSLLSIKLLSTTSHGSLVDQPDFSYSYIPDNGFTGLDSFKYEICDTTILPGVCDSATVIITVEPEAINDTLDIVKNDSLLFLPMSNDIINPVVTTIDTLIGPQNGTLVINSGGEFVYVPDMGFVGSDSFMYVVCDTSSSVHLCDSAVVFVSILPESPVAVNDVFVTEFNVSLSIPILANDDIKNVANTVVSSVKVETTSGALVSINLDGTINYAPFNGFRGLDTLSYVICDTSVMPNLCDSALVQIMVGPLAVDDSLMTLEGLSVFGFPLGNDTVNVAKTSFEIIPFTGLNGVITTDDNLGRIEYIPGPFFSGVDTVYLKVCDTSRTPHVCDTSLLTIKVLPSPPVVISDFVEIFVNQAVNIQFLLNDVIPHRNETKTVLIVDPNFGEINEVTDSTFQYTPDLNFLGLDSVQYVLCDTSITPWSCDTGWVVISVVERDPPFIVDDVSATYLNVPVNINVLLNDLIPNIGTTVFSDFGLSTLSGADVNLETDGSITYTPFVGFKGIDTLFYELCDTAAGLEGLCDTGIVLISVAPDAVDDSVSIKTNEVVVIDVLVNDTLNDDFSEITLISGPINGGVLDSISGTITYVSDSNFVGYDTLVVAICDTSGDTQVCDTSLVIVKVVPSVFITIDDEYYLAPNTDLLINTLENDTLSPEGNLTYAFVSFPQNGIVEKSLGFEFVFTPSANFNGNDEFIYAVCDTVLVPEICDTAVVSIIVSDLPLAVTDTLFLNEDEVGTINLLSNDIDVKGSTSIENVTLIGTESNGIIVWDSTGVVTFVPDLNFFGEINYTCLVSDGEGNSTSSSLVIIVSSVNDRPETILKPETLILVNNGENGRSPNVLLNNSDSDNDELYVKNIIFSKADFIGYTLSDSTISYLPTIDFVGTDTVLYNVCDRGTPELCVVDTLFVVVTEQEENNLFIPEAFSPNNDGINDYFEIIGLENYNENSLKVFNRWGVTVFQENGYKNNWDGTNNVSLSGAILPSAGYLYVLKLTSVSGEEVVMKGSVFINR